MSRSTHPTRASWNCRDGGPPVQARRCPTGGGRQSRPGAGGNLLGEPSVDPRNAVAKRSAGDSSMGAKPRPVWRNARPPGFNGPRLSVDVVLIDCAGKQAKAQVGPGGLAPQAQDRAVKGGKEAAGRPSPRSADRRGVQARRSARRSGAARPESDFGKRLRESLAIARNLPKSLSGECVKTAPKSRAGFEHENATQ